MCETLLHEPQRRLSKRQHRAVIDAAILCFLIMIYALFIIITSPRAPILNDVDGDDDDDDDEDDDDDDGDADADAVDDDDS